MVNVQTIRKVKYEAAANSHKSIFFASALMSECAASKSNKYVILAGAQTATLITQERYRKTSGKGRHKKKQKLYVRTHKSECRGKPLEIMPSEWRDKSIQLQANVELVIGQSKSSRKGKTISSCLTQVIVKLQPKNTYELNFEGFEDGCQFKVINTTDPSEIFEVSRPDISQPKAKIIDFKIDRRPYCTGSIE